MLVDLGQGHGFVQLGELLFVGVLVDGFLEDEGLDELVFAALQIRDLPLGGGPLSGDLLVPSFPVIQDDDLEEGHELGARP
ncbi:MAG TPA: hypothetical protein VKM72_00525 [Thermoanaerobaculia bacterium]|nr:hypothetical protein [Thermoanaerobaculia bacterium]